MAHFDHETEKPIVIDNGGDSIKAGWSGEDAPQIVLDHVIGKHRSDLRRVDPRLLYVSDFTADLPFS